MKKRGARGKDANARSLPLSSSPSFGHSTTYAEVGRRTREREKKIYREEKSFVRSELLPSSTTTTTTAVRKKTMLICEIRKAINRTLVKPIHTTSTIRIITGMQYDYIILGELPTF